MQMVNVDVCPSGSITDLFVGDDAQIIGDLTVEGTTNIAGLTATTISGTAVTFTTIGGTSLALQNGGITAAGAIAGATTISGSGNAQFGGTLDVSHGKFSIDASGQIDLCPSGSITDLFVGDDAHFVTVLIQGSHSNGVLLSVGNVTSSVGLHITNGGSYCWCCW